MREILVAVAIVLAFVGIGGSVLSVASGAWDSRWQDHFMWMGLAAMVLMLLAAILAMVAA